ncbi:alpha/beta hydrolase [Microbacterium sp. cx-55]|uniref:alpha/beta fold hydrolase n=1 Tax=unclassified Microbacterium TaxID=2609290 RepID=UPI001CBD95FB|nr:MULTISPECIES: alpha/beta hydrolase [unclassified Microbacterium]MBZ4485861.1 alpha/beta hydrolase [Microbacterium sp. cx-55]MCC4906821.1 alpha/beta hydrolase [Microbacterium sp. cx-59]UGB34262.1 alpha/beta hydrolase [Microbacterium sp. cx-55]
MPDSQIFEPDGRAIPFEVEGDGPAVVLLPGQGLNIGYLGPLAHSVAQEDFHLIRIGARRPTDAAVTLHDLAQDVVDVLDHLGVADAWVGGHAFGGTVARFVAIDHHDRVNGVLLLGVEGTAGSDGPDDGTDVARDKDLEAMQRAAREATGELSALADGVPVLIIQGTEDTITPTANGELLRAAAPGLVSVVAVEGGGHLFPATHVGATSWAIEDYLDWD